VGYAWLIGGARWLGAGRKLAHRGRAVDKLVTPAPQTLCSSSNRAAGDSQPPAYRLGTTQDPAGDAPAEGRVARRVIHALIDRLIQFLCSRAVLHAAEDPLFTATCGERARGCSPIVCGQPLARVQRTTPRRKPVGDCYLPKTGR